MQTNAKRPEAAHIMDLATRLGTAVGTAHYMAAHRELHEAVYAALHRPARAEGELRAELEDVRAQLADAQHMLLVRRGELQQLAAIHGDTAANDRQARAAA